MRNKPEESLGPCAVPNWAEMTAKGVCPLPSLDQLPFYSPAAGEEGWKTYSSFRFTDIPGAPRVGDISAPWVEALVRYWFAAQDPTTGARAVPEMFLLTAKKATKTSIFALLLLAQFVMTKRRNAQALLFAPRINVADLAFRLIVGAVDTTPGLRDRFTVAPAERALKDKRTDQGWRTQLKVVSADLSVLAGTTAQYIMIDEMHLFEKMTGAEHMMEHVRGARSGRPDSSAIICSTHPHLIAQGIWPGELDAYRRIRDNKLKTPHLMVSYEFPEAMLKRKEHLDPKNWHMVNPNIGYSATLDWMQENRAFYEAKGPDSLSGWDNQFLNVDPHYNNPPNAWPGARYWDGAIDKDKRLGRPDAEGLNALLERCEICVIGIDGGGMYDLLSLYVIGREHDRGVWLGWGHSWCHKGMEQSHPAVWKRLKRFASIGELSVVDYCVSLDGKNDKTLNLDEMSRLVSYINSTGKLIPKGGVGVDEGGMPTLADSLHSLSLPCPVSHDQVERVKQGAALNPVHDGMATRVATRTFRHGGQQLMKWAVQNVVREDHGKDNYIIVKRREVTHAKIDPFIAMANAARMLYNSPDGRGGYKIVKVGLS